MYRSLVTQAVRQHSRLSCAAIPCRTYTTTSITTAQAAADTTSHSTQPALKPTPEHTPTTFRGIVDKYGGLYPLIGLGSAIAITKEFLIINEEFLMVSNFLAVAVAGYVVLSDTILQQQKETVELDQKVYNDWGALESDGLKAVLAAHQRNLAQADAIRYIKNQYNKLIVQAYKAKNVQAQISIRDTIEKKLNEIIGREQAETSSKAKAVTVQATNTVKDYFKNADKNTKQQLIENAIQLLSGGTKTIPAERDPVKQAFLRFFKENKA